VHSHSAAKTVVFFVDSRSPFFPPSSDLPPQTTWNLFPFVYFAAIDGALSLEISEPLWAALDWLTKMVYRWVVCLTRGRVTHVWSPSS
jgi:hypothetical protein